MSLGDAARGGRGRDAARAQSEQFPSGPDPPPVIRAPRAARPRPPASPAPACALALVGRNTLLALRESAVSDGHGPTLWSFTPPIHNSPFRGLDEEWPGGIW
jgi:hypothetical protein